MNRIILVSHTSVVANVSGIVWKLDKNNQRHLVYKGEVLEAGDRLELDTNADVQVQSFEPPQRIPITPPQLPVAPTVQRASRRSGQNKGKSESLVATEAEELFTPSITPEAGFPTVFTRTPAPKFTKYSGINKNTFFDDTAAITIKTPITPDNIVNLRESGSLPLSGTVKHIEPSRPIILTLTDSAGNTVQVNANVDASGNRWSATITDLKKKGLVDGPVELTANSSDFAGNKATAKTTFTLDTVTEVTLELAPQSQCAEQPSNHLTKDTKPKIKGTGEPNSTILLTVDGENYSTRVDPKGQWFLQISKTLADGKYQLQANITDTAGNTANAALDLTIDTKAGLWINDIDSFKNAKLEIKGTTTDIENDQLVKISIQDLNSGIPASSATYSAKVNNDAWGLLPQSMLFSPVNAYEVSAKSEDLACNIAKDHLPLIGNPKQTEINEKGGLGITYTVDPIASVETKLTFTNELISSMPKGVVAIDGGKTFPLSWRLDSPQQLQGIYDNTKKAITVNLPNNGGEKATVTLHQPLKHTDDVINLDIPYQKALLSNTHKKYHYSQAAIPITVIDDKPILTDHKAVEVIEGKQVNSNKNGKLFQPENLGADGGKLTSINGTPLSAENEVTLKTGGVYHKFDGKYGTLFVTPNGSWIYAAKPDQKHPASGKLREDFKFTVTDTDGDSASAKIAFDVLDGTPPSISTVDGININQDCEAISAPATFVEPIKVIKGSDTIKQLQFDIEATKTAIIQSLQGKNLNSAGEPLQLDALNPEAKDQRFTLKTTSGKPVVTISLTDAKTTDEGDLNVKLQVALYTNLEYFGDNPAAIPVVLKASDADISSASHTVTVSVRQGNFSLKDDSATVPEGNELTGNLLANVRPCLSPLKVASVLVDPVLVNNTALAAKPRVEFEIGNDPLKVLMVNSELTIDSKGNYSFKAKDSLDSTTPSRVSFEYKVEDTSGNTQKGTFKANIEDGDPPAGGEALSVEITEKDLAAGSYPAFSSTPLTTLTSGSDALDATSVKFTDISSALNGVVTAQGAPVVFTIDGKKLLGSVNEGGKTKTILTYNLEAIKVGEKDLGIRIHGKLARPLDHQEGTKGTDSITVNGNDITIKLPFTYNDMDGTPADKPGLVTATIFDGKPPSIEPESSVQILETGFPVTADGKIAVSPHSDPIKPDTWGFTAEQPGLKGLSASGKPLLFSIRGSTLSLYTEDAPTKPVLTVALNDRPKKSTVAELNYTVTQNHPVDHKGGKWSVKVGVSVADQDGDIATQQLQVNIKDRADSIEVKPHERELTLKEPIYQSTKAEEGKTDVTITSTSDAITRVAFKQPAQNSDGYAIDDSGNQLNSDRQPIRYFPVGPTTNPGETWEGWSMKGGTKARKIFTLTTKQPDGTPFQVPAKSSATKPVTIVWHQYIDHLTGDGKNTPELAVTYTLQATDIDGTTASSQITLQLQDGAAAEFPEITPIEVTTTDPIWGITTDTAKFSFTPGSDRPIPVFDLKTIKDEFQELSSNGQKLTRFKLSGKEDSILTISTANHVRVFKLSIDKIKTNGATIKFQQLKNIDHPDNKGENSVKLDVPLLLKDSDETLDSPSLEFHYTVKDTVPVAKDFKVVGIEGQTLKGYFFAHVDVKADANRAALTEITIPGATPKIYTVSQGKTSVIPTSIGKLLVTSSGQWQLKTNAHIDHASGKIVKLKLNYTIRDGDGDTASAPFEFDIADKAATFQNIKNTSGNEDTKEPIPVQFALNLGDRDRNETLKNIVIPTSDLQGGQLTFAGEAIAAVDGQIQIPDAALIKSTVSGNVVFTAKDLGYLPGKDKSDYSFKGGKITLNLRATVTTNDGEQTPQAKLYIHIKCVADAPIWPDKIAPITGLEDKIIPFKPGGKLVTASLKDTDGSELLSYNAKVLSGGIKLRLANGAKVSETKGLTPDQYEKLAIAPTKNWSGMGKVEINAVATEQGRNCTKKQASTPMTFTVGVAPVADKPTLNVFPTSTEADLTTLSGLEDQKFSIGDHISTKLVDNDGSESLFLKITPLLSSDDIGKLLIKDPEKPQGFTEVPKKGDHFIVEGENVPKLFYQPPKDRSSANFPTLKIQLNAISRESTQDGIAPAKGKEQATSNPAYIQFNLKGVVDEPVITPNKTWQIDSTDRFVLTSEWKEDIKLPLQFSLKSGDIDKSESLNVVVKLNDPRFLIQDNDGNWPPIAGKNTFQITPEAINTGKYLITPPTNYAGKPTLTLKVQVTELDGDNKAFTYTLKPKFWPVIDTTDQTLTAPIYGKEVQVDLSGNYINGGAAFSLQGLVLKDNKSESVTDITRVELPDNVKLLINGKLTNSVDGSLAKLLGGAAQFQAAMASKAIKIIPVNSEGKIDSDYPTPTSRNTAFSYTANILDQENGLKQEGTIKVSGNVLWTGEVDGSQPPEKPFNPKENTQVSIDNPGPVTGNDFPLHPLKLLSTDTDGSEQLVPNQHEIRVFKKGSDVTNPSAKIVDGWYLKSDGSQTVLFDDDAWLVRDGPLTGVSVHFNKAGEYVIQINGLVEDVGDREVRWALMNVAVTEDSANTTQPVTPENVVACPENKPLLMKEDERLKIPDNCLDISKTNTQADEVISFKITPRDFKGWQLYNYTTTYWESSIANKVQNSTWIIAQDDFAKLEFIPPKDFSGEQTLPYEVVKQNTESGLTSKNRFTMKFKVTPVVEDKISISSSAITTEWKDSEKPAPLNLAIKPTDQDGSETLETITFSPPKGIVIKGEGLEGNKAIRGATETEEQFEARIGKFTFTVEKGVQPGAYRLPFSVQVKDAGAGTTDEKTFNESIPITINVINNCAILKTANQSGTENKDIFLADLYAQLNDRDGSEVLSVKLSGVPNNTVLNDARGKQLPNNGGGEWQIPVNLIAKDTGKIETITLKPPTDRSGIFDLTLTAFSHEKSLSDICTNAKKFKLAIEPLGNPVTVDRRLPSAIKIDENSDWRIQIDAKTTDTYHDAKDLPERVKAVFTINGDASIFPQEPDAEKPSLHLLTGGTPTFFEKKDDSYTSVIESKGSEIEGFIFNPGDGHGKLILRLSVRSVDEAIGLKTALGPEINMSTNVTVVPKSDPPTVKVIEKTLSGNSNTPIALDITANVVNPALKVRTPMGTELYAQIQGLPPSATLTNSAGEPVGTKLVDGSIGLKVAQLTGLKLIDTQKGTYDLTVRAVSDVGDGSPKMSAPVTIPVTINEAPLNDFSVTPPLIGEELVSIASIAAHTPNHDQESSPQPYIVHKQNGDQPSVDLIDLAAIEQNTTNTIELAEANDIIASLEQHETIPLDDTELTITNDTYENQHTESLTPELLISFNGNESIINNTDHQLYDYTDLTGRSFVI